MYEMKDINKSYPSKIVLRDFSLSLPKQGVVTLMGPSGCGKTTLLRLLAGLEATDSGRRMLPQSVKISMVFQEDRLLEVLTARENIRAVLPARNDGLVERCLVYSGLADAGELYPAEMSGGMRRRLAIARAIAYGGEILLLDEPFKGLDLETKNRVMDMVFEDKDGLPGAGRRLTFMVTHDMEEAVSVSDTILLAEGIPLTIRKAIQNKEKGRRS